MKRKDTVLTESCIGSCLSDDRLPLYLCLKPCDRTSIEWYWQRLCDVWWSFWYFLSSFVVPYKYLLLVLFYLINRNLWRILLKVENTERFTYIIKILKFFLIYSILFIDSCLTCFGVEKGVGFMYQTNTNRINFHCNWEISEVQW